MYRSSGLPNASSSRANGTTCRAFWSVRVGYLVLLSQKFQTPGFWLQDPFEVWFLEPYAPNLAHLQPLGLSWSSCDSCGKPVRFIGRGLPRHPTDLRTAKMGKHHRRTAAGLVYIPLMYSYMTPGGQGAAGAMYISYTYKQLHTQAHSNTKSMNVDIHRNTILQTQALLHVRMCIYIIYTNKYVYISSYVICTVYIVYMCSYVICTVYIV